LTTVVYRIGFAQARSVAEQAYGSTLFDGRWHSLRAGPRPRRVIYANGVAPINQTLFALILPEELAIAHAHERGLPAHWRDDLSASQVFGNAWLDRGQDLALWVPSFVEPAEDNLLIHPEHPRIGEVGIRVEREPFEFDPRLS
jgi:RES domain-containing protein